MTNGFDASLYLIEKHTADVMMFTFMSIDTVQHYFWQFMDPTHHYHDASAAREFGEAVFRVYERLDNAVGRIVEKVSPDTSVFVLSDHGGGPTSDRVLYLNRFLAQLGLLHYIETKDSPLQKITKGFLRWSEPRSPAQLPQPPTENHARERGACFAGTLRNRCHLGTTKINWSRTKAFCSEVLASPPGIWINRKGAMPAGIVDEGEDESLLTLIAQKLGELRDPRTGESIVKRVFRRGEIYHGPYLDEAPDLTLDWWNTSLFSTSPQSSLSGTEEPPVEVIERKLPTTAEWGGTHRRRRYSDCLRQTLPEGN